MEKEVKIARRSQRKGKSCYEVQAFAFTTNGATAPISAQIMVKEERPAAKESQGC